MNGARHWLVSTVLGLAVSAITSKVVGVAHIDEHWIHLKGVHPGYLARFPSSAAVGR